MCPGPELKSFGLPITYDFPLCPSLKCVVGLPRGPYPGGDAPLMYDGVDATIAIDIVATTVATTTTDITPIDVTTFTTTAACLLV